SFARSSDVFAVAARFAHGCTRLRATPLRVFAHATTNEGYWKQGPTVVWLLGVGDRHPCVFTVRVGACRCGLRGCMGQMVNPTFVCTAQKSAQAVPCCARVSGTAIRCNGARWRTGGPPFSIPSHSEV